MKVIRKTPTVLGLYLLVLLALTMLYAGSCTSKLDGTMTPNQKPLVWFVNVPPEDYSTSINPILYWVGQDRDGQIKYFRYIVIREDAIADSLGLSGRPTDTDVQDFISTVLLVSMKDSLWTELYVNSEEGLPQTSNIVPMQAELENPVLTFVSQYVFVQAFDEEDLGSDVVYRRYQRNDNPPETSIQRKMVITEQLFINAASASVEGSNTGIRLTWKGEDIVDYPTDPPAFEFEWKMFGPYLDDEFEQLIDEYVVPVFVSSDAQLFRFGDYNTQMGCDTFWTGGEIDSIVCDSATLYVTVDTSFDALGNPVFDSTVIDVDTVHESTVYGTIDTIFRVKDADFAASPLYRVVDSSMEVILEEQSDGTVDTIPTGSVWISDTIDVLYNVYWNAPCDTTQEQNFMFWVRARDDADVPDLTPDFGNLRVIDPKKERDFLILETGKTASQNRAFVDSVKAFWGNAIENWALSRPDLTGVSFDPDVDYLRYSDWVNDAALLKKFLKTLLSYKVVIITNDDVVANAFGAAPSSDGAAYIYTALYSGVNMWVASRVPLGSFDVANPAGQVIPSPDGNYATFFGVEEYQFTGWTWWALKGEPEKYRIEDFIGALSLNTDRWPNLVVDTALLHRRYVWPSRYPWADSLGALPEVGWAVRNSSTTEAMYLYKSLYGADHFLGAGYSFHGRPVAHRLNGGLFRTMHWLFTPLSIKEPACQQIVNSVFDWLYPIRQDNEASAADKGVYTREELAKRYWDTSDRASSGKEFLDMLSR